MKFEKGLFTLAKKLNELNIETCIEILQEIKKGNDIGENLSFLDDFIQQIHKFYEILENEKENKSDD